MVTELRVGGTFQICVDSSDDKTRGRYKCHVTKLDPITSIVDEETILLHYTRGDKLGMEIPWEERDVKEAKRWLLDKFGSVAKMKKFCHKGVNHGKHLLNSEIFAAVKKIKRDDLNDVEIGPDGKVVEDDDEEEECDEDGEQVYCLRGKDCKFVEMSMAQMRSNQEIQKHEKNVINTLIRHRLRGNISLICFVISSSC